MADLENKAQSFVRTQSTGTTHHGTLPLTFMINQNAQTTKVVNLLKERLERVSDLSQAWVWLDSALRRLNSVGADFDDYALTGLCRIETGIPASAEGEKSQEQITQELVRAIQIQQRSEQALGDLEDSQALDLIKDVVYRTYVEFTGMSGMQLRKMALTAQSLAVRCDEARIPLPRTLIREIQLCPSAGSEELHLRLDLVGRGLQSNLKGAPLPLIPPNPEVIQFFRKCILNNLDTLEARGQNELGSAAPDTTLVTACTATRAVLKRPHTTGSLLRMIDVTKRLCQLDSVSDSRPEVQEFANSAVGWRDIGVEEVAI